MKTNIIALNDKGSRFPPDTKLPSVWENEGNQQKNFYVKPCQGT